MAGNDVNVVGDEVDGEFVSQNRQNRQRGDEDRRRAEGESGARGDRGDGGMAVGVRKVILTNQAEYLVSD